MIKSTFSIIAIFYLFSIGLSQEVEVMKFDDLEKIINEKPAKIKILNFWATFCRPCVIEMPFFEEVAIKFEDDIDLIFVSLDFVENVENKVKPFLTKKNIHSRVILLDDTDYNSWIDRVNPNWSGAIPATLIIDKNTGEKFFFEKIFDKEELESLINKFVNKT